MSIGLVKIIMRARGDDIAGAVDDLTRIGGFPEEVAQRIATGELPMDEASRLARANEQGYGGVLYHGSPSPDLTEIAPMVTGKRNAPGGNGLFVSDNPKVASTYTHDHLRPNGTGFGGGTVYPLRIKNVDPSERVTVSDRENRTTFWDDISAEKIDGLDSIYDSDQFLITDQINRTANRANKKTVEYSNLMDSAEDIYNQSSTVPSNVTAVLDNTIVRSPNAAFDPKYKGSNIMGGAAGMAGLAGLLATGQSEDSEASVASLAKRGLKLAESRSDGVDGPDSLFKIVDGKDKEIGGAEFWVTPGGDYNAYAMRLNPEHRGSGIMSEAYDAIEEVSGRMIEPSDVLTEDGMKFWIRRDPRKMQKLYERERFDYYEKDVLDSIFAEALEAKR